MNDNLSRFHEFCLEREAIRLRRFVGKPPPWTEDPILGRYRFCNVNREHDTVTVWIRQHIRDPYANDRALWWNLCMARLFNWPDTLAGIGYVQRFNAATIKSRAMDVGKRTGKIFTGAYIVSTNGVKMPKVDYIVDRVLAPLWRHGVEDGVFGGGFETCYGWATYLMNHIGFSDFMANQVVTDMKYTPLCCYADDVATFCLAGPGTIRGLNRLLGANKDAPMTRKAAHAKLIDVRDALRTSPLHPHFTDLNNLSNCFCEWDKYERVRLGEGKPRSTYTPTV